MRVVASHSVCSSRSFSPHLPSFLFNDIRAKLFASAPSANGSVAPSPFHHATPNLLRLNDLANENRLAAEERAALEPASPTLAKLRAARAGSEAAESQSLGRSGTFKPAPRPFQRSKSVAGGPAKRVFEMRGTVEMQPKRAKLTTAEPAESQSQSQSQPRTGAVRTNKRKASSPKRALPPGAAMLITQASRPRE